MWRLTFPTMTGLGWLLALELSLAVANDFSATAETPATSASWKPTPFAQRIPTTSDGLPIWAAEETPKFVVPTAPVVPPSQILPASAIFVAAGAGSTDRTSQGWVARRNLDETQTSAVATADEHKPTIEVSPSEVTQEVTHQVVQKQPEVVQAQAEADAPAKLPPPPPAPPAHDAHSAPEPLPQFHDVETPIVEPLVTPIPEMIHDHHGSDCNCDACEKFGPLRRLLMYSELRSGDVGIGAERVAFAPFQIEQAQPYRNNKVRMDAAYGLTSPDRAEYFWGASGGTGPAIPEGEIDYFDFRYITESGSDKMSVTTDIPIRVLDYGPDTTTGGLSNINIGTKTAIVTGDDWYVSNIMRIYLPVGSESHGTANGHLSLEPGMLTRYRFRDDLYFHGQLKWWIPFGGNKAFTGQVLNYGVGMSYILYETDAVAVLPTLELDGWSVLSGSKTLPDGTVTAIGGDSFINVLGGVRYTLGPPGDLGLFEFGIMGGFQTGDEGWYENLMRMELRWTF